MINNIRTSNKFRSLGLVIQVLITIAALYLKFIGITIFPTTIIIIICALLFSQCINYYVTMRQYKQILDNMFYRLNLLDNEKEKKGKGGEL